MILPPGLLRMPLRVCGSHKYKIHEDGFYFFFYIFIFFYVFY